MLAPNFCMFLVWAGIYCQIAIAFAEVRHEHLPKDCGRVPTKTRRIAGGYYPELGSFPSYVGLQISAEANTTKRFCGAVIISERLVLTAGHCISLGDNEPQTNGKPIRIDLDSTRPFPDNNSVPLLVDRVCMPKHYYLIMPARNDLAILQLNRPIKFDKYTQPACLTDRQLDDRTPVYAVGQGFTEVPSQSPPDELKAVRSKLTKCVPMPVFRQICIRYDDPQVPGSPCQGDSGGPLIGEVNGRQTIFGIVSQGGQKCTAKQLVGLVDLHASKELFNRLLRDCTEFL